MEFEIFDLRIVTSFTEGTTLTTLTIEIYDALIFSFPDVAFSAPRQYKFIIPNRRLLVMNRKQIVPSGKFYQN